MLASVILRAHCKPPVDNRRCIIQCLFPRCRLPAGQIKRCGSITTPFALHPFCAHHRRMLRDNAALREQLGVTHNVAIVRQRQRKGRTYSVRVAA